jgi:hypothetical protein
MLEECTNRFLKSGGSLVHGRWFCSLPCSDKDPDVIEMKELYEKGINFANDQVEEDEEEYCNDEDIDL